MSRIDLLLLVNRCSRVQMKICDIDKLAVTVAIAYAQNRLFYAESRYMESF